MRIVTAAPGLAHERAEDRREDNPSSANGDGVAGKQETETTNR